MGTQIHIYTHELLKLDCKVEFTAYKYEDDIDITPYYSTQAMVTCPEGEVFYMSYCNLRDLSLLTSDYNEWGSNKAVISPKVKKYNIPYVIS